MLGDLTTASLGVVVLGLLASVGWGLADFGGGLASRRAPVLGVLLFSQVAGLIAALPLVLVAGEPAMSVTDVTLSLSAGALGAGGLALLYRGLAVGRMGVVAPVAGVLTASIPVAFGMLTQGVPAAAALAGMAFGLASVVLVSRSPGGDDARPSGLGYGLGSGLAFGAFAVAIAQLGDGLAISPIPFLRGASIAAVGAFVAVRGAPWRVAPRLLPALIVVGTLDMLATALYTAALGIGPVAIAAVLASLYPVVTVILAVAVLRERLAVAHGLGIAAAGLAIALIAGATAG